jgi:hypothetical protein
MCCVNRGKRGLDLARRRNGRNQRGVKNNAISRLGRTALMLHRFVEGPHMLADVVDRYTGQAAHLLRRLMAIDAGYGSCPWRLEVRNAFAQHRHEVGHHMPDRVFDPKKIGIEVGVRDPVANLTFEPRIKLILGHRLQDRAVAIGAWIFEIFRHVDGLGRHRNFVDALPGPLKIGPARAYHPDLRIDVTLPFVRTQRIGQGCVESGGSAQSLGAPKDSFDRALVRIDREEAGRNEPRKKPGSDSN